MKKSLFFNHLAFWKIFWKHFGKFWNFQNVENQKPVRLLFLFVRKVGGLFTSPLERYQPTPNPHTPNQTTNSTSDKVNLNLLESVLKSILESILERFWKPNTLSKILKINVFWKFRLNSIKHITLTYIKVMPCLSMVFFRLLFQVIDKILFWKVFWKDFEKILKSIKVIEKQLFSKTGKTIDIQRF